MPFYEKETDVVCPICNGARGWWNSVFRWTRLSKHTFWTECQTCNGTGRLITKRTYYKFLSSEPEDDKTDENET